MNNKIAELGLQYEDYLYYKYPYCPDIVNSLLLLKYSNPSCLSKELFVKYQNILSEYLYSCSITTKELIIDSTNKESWEELNPECTSKKQWELISSRICKKYHIEIEVLPIETVCNIAFEITKKIIPCDVLTSISIQKKLCDLNITIKLDKIKCDAEFKLLIEKYPTCTLTKKEYINLVKLNYSFETIANIYKNNLCLNIDYNNQVYLKTLIDSYNVKDLVFKKIPKENTEIIYKILSDYPITNTQKETILKDA